MIILGIDPGLSITGWGIIETNSRNDLRALQYGAIYTKPINTLIERLKIVNAELQQIIDEYKPSSAAIEELFFLKEARSVAAIGQSRGAIILTLSLNNMPLFEYNPRLVKMALTGYGSADKMQMQRMAQTLLKLKEIPKPDDAADALAIAICHIHTVNNEILK